MGLLTTASVAIDGSKFKALPKVAAEMALSVLAYNLTRVINIIGAKRLMHIIAA
jgi:hypothetical protein